MFSDETNGYFLYSVGCACYLYSLSIDNVLFKLKTHDGIIYEYVIDKMTEKVVDVDIDQLISELCINIQNFMVGDYK